MNCWQLRMSSINLKRFGSRGGTAIATVWMLRVIMDLPDGRFDRVLPDVASL